MKFHDLVKGYLLISKDLDSTNLYDVDDEKKIYFLLKCYFLANQMFVFPKAKLVFHVIEPDLLREGDNVLPQFGHNRSHDSIFVWGYP